MGSSRTPNVSAASSANTVAKQSARTKSGARRSNTGYVPGATPRRSAKAADSGALKEHHITTGMQRAGIPTRRLPGIVGLRLNGRLLRPDASCVIDGLDRYGVHLRDPEIRGRDRYNVVIEIKSQTVPGSAERKIGQSIEDLAHHSDASGVPAALILYTPVFTRADIDALKAKGRLHSVAVLTAEEAIGGQLAPAVLEVARQRRNMARRIDGRGRYTPTKRMHAHEAGMLARLEERRMVGR